VNMELTTEIQGRLDRQACRCGSERQRVHLVHMRCPFSSISSMNCRFSLNWQASLLLYLQYSCVLLATGTQSAPALFYLAPDRGRSGEKVPCKYIRQHSLLCAAPNCFVEAVGLGFMRCAFSRACIGAIHVRELCHYLSTKWLHRHYFEVAA